jgi:anti-anti-sigma factor
MQVKIDTKEKFHVITIQERELTANMTAELEQSLSAYLQNDVKSLVLNLEGVSVVHPLVAEMLVRLQQRFYEQSASFVLCCIQPQVEEFLDREGLLEILNATPSESEAWDMVQMEEIERELMDDDEPEFLNND